MKKKTVYKLIGIGSLHTLLYLYLIPFIIVPTYGDNGIKVAVTIAVVISITIIMTILIEKLNRSKKNEKDGMGK